MFRNSAALREVADARSFSTAHRRWAAKSRDWFDGSIDSIDARIAATDRLLAMVTRTALNATTGSANTVQAHGPALRRERERLAGVREDVLRQGGFLSPVPREAVTERTAAAPQSYVDFDDALMY